MLLTFIVFIVGTLATSAATLGVVASSILLRASRRVVYGHTPTYVNE